MVWCACSMRNHLQGINGSGKHNNWSLTRPTPAKTFLIRIAIPAKNLQFLLLSCSQRSRQSMSTAICSAYQLQLLEMTTVWAVTRHRQLSCPCLSEMIWKDSSRYCGKRSPSLEAKEVQTMKPGAKVLPHFIERYNRSQPYFSVCLYRQ